MSKPEEERFLEAKIIVTVMGQGADAASFASELSRMSLSRIGSEMNNGDFIGSVSEPIVEEVAPDQVAHRLRDLGNDGHFFDLYEETVPQGTAREDAAGRILRTQMEQGWSNETLEALGRKFIEKAGLSNAFADFLEAQAAEENEMSVDPDGGL